MAEIQLDHSDSGQARAAVEGDDIVLALDEIATSGYRWEVQAFDPAVLAAGGDSFEPPEPGRLGASGTHRFRFRVIGAGSSQVRLIRRRPWDPDAIADTFETTIEATPKTEPEIDL